MFVIGGMCLFVYGIFGFIVRSDCVSRVFDGIVVKLMDENDLVVDCSV